jgi:hypothetical protein
LEGGEAFDQWETLSKYQPIGKRALQLYSLRGLSKIKEKGLILHGEVTVVSLKISASRTF